VPGDLDEIGTVYPRGPYSNDGLAGLGRTRFGDLGVLEVVERA
jgi:hypothetical protein